MLKIIIHKVIYMGLFDAFGKNELKEKPRDQTQVFHIAGGFFTI